MTYFDQQAALAREMGIGHLFQFGKQASIFAHVSNIVQPSNILEIGFFKGHSAFMWLSQSDAKLTSVDPMRNLYDGSVAHDGDKGGVQKLQDLYGHRFTFIEQDSKLVGPLLVGQRFDLMFMDGDHWPAGVRSDFNLALALGIDWILADDFVTDVKETYEKEFASRYFIVAQYPRTDLHNGQPIPMALLRRIDPTNWRMMGLDKPAQVG